MLSRSADQHTWREPVYGEVSAEARSQEIREAADDIGNESCEAAAVKAHELHHIIIDIPINRYQCLGTIPTQQFIEMCAFLLAEVQLRLS